jgi:hypothetical protein
MKNIPSMVAHKGCQAILRGNLTNGGNAELARHLIHVISGAFFPVKPSRADNDIMLAECTVGGPGEGHRGNIDRCDKALNVRHFVSGALTVTGSCHGMILELF